MSTMNEEARIAAAKTTRRLRRSFHRTCSVEQSAELLKNAIPTGVANTKPSEITRSTANIENACDTIEKEMGQRRAARRRQCQRRRPDSSGMINNKECHILAFYEEIEEMMPAI